jgi:hypothetical protein
VAQEEPGDDDRDETRRPQLFRGQEGHERRDQVDHDVGVGMHDPGAHPVDEHTGDGTDSDPAHAGEQEPAGRLRE